MTSLAKWEGETTYPEIRGSSVEVEHEFLGRCADFDLTKVLRVVLLVLGGNLARLAAVGGSDELVLAAKASSSGNIGVGEAAVLEGGDMLVGTGLGGLEAKPVHEIDVGLGAVALVVLVGDGHDLLEAELLLELGLGCECGLHVCFAGSHRCGS